MVLKHSIKQLLGGVLSEIAPDALTRASVLPFVELFLEKLNSRFRTLRVNAKAQLGGSYAKDTWLKGDYDVDVFACFSLKHKHDDLSGLLAKALVSWKPVRLHGSRDYFQIKSKINFEVVPVLAISSADDALNTTDFSPLHVSWVLKHRSLVSDIRLFKRFCKANGVYGAESYIRGVSGHVADLIVIFYGGFLLAVSAIAKWVPKVVLDQKNVYKGKALLVLNKSKTEGPLVIVDPVQPDRNASAALTLEKFDALVSVAKRFVVRPSKSFFVDKPVDFVRLAAKGFLVRVECVPLDEKSDVAGTKVLKIFELLRDKLSIFGVKKSGWSWPGFGPALLWFVLKNSKLSDEVVVSGPPFGLKEHVSHFKRVHKKVFVKGNKLFAFVPRDFTTPRAFVSGFLKSGFVKERVKSARLV